MHRSSIDDKVSIIDDNIDPMFCLTQVVQIVLEHRFQTIMVMIVIQQEHSVY